MVTAATKVMVSSGRLVLKVLANPWASTLGSEAGRNWVLEFFSTLVSEGRETASTTVTTIQPAMISQRNRTVNRPRAANKR